MTEAIATEIVKQGGRTVFVDLRRAKNDALYLTLTTLGRDKDGADERRTVRLFGEQIDQVAAAISTLLTVKKDAEVAAS